MRLTPSTGMHFCLAKTLREMIRVGDGALSQPVITRNVGSFPFLAPVAHSSWHLVRPEKEVRENHSTQNCGGKYWRVMLLRVFTADAVHLTSHLKSITVKAWHLEARMIWKIFVLLARIAIAARERKVRSNHSVERDRPQAALVGSLRGFGATAAPHVKRYSLVLGV